MVGAERACLVASSHAAKVVNPRKDKVPGNMPGFGKGFFQIFNAKVGKEANDDPGFSDDVQEAQHVRQDL